MNQAALHPELQDLQTWDRIETRERLAVAQAVARQLPRSFHFLHLQAHSLGTQNHEVAFFEYKGARFALLPGGRVELGYDFQRSTPGTLARASIREQQAQGVEPLNDQMQYLERHLSKIRVVDMAPMLYEVEARPFELLTDDIQTAWQLSGKPSKSLVAGFRLPSPDEWEYACASGSRTLFRWGNDWPGCRPQDAMHWDLHQCPNSFGLLMNTSLTNLEVCDGIQFRGGDAGQSLGRRQSSYLEAWLPFASSYVVPEEDESSEWFVEELLVRRVWPLFKDHD